MKNMLLIKLFSMACLTAVLAFLAFANAVYGQTVEINGTPTKESRGDAKCAAPVMNPIREPDPVRSALFIQSASSAASNVQAADAAEKVSIAEVYARLFDEIHVAWTEPRKP
jgi:hypothetical protein